MDLRKFKDVLNDAVPQVLDFALKQYKDLGSFGLFTDDRCTHLVVVANTDTGVRSTCEYKLWSEDFISDGLAQDTIDKLEELDKIFAEIFEVEDSDSDNDDFVFSDLWLSTRKEVFELCVDCLADLNKKTDHDIIMGFDPFGYDEAESIRFFKKMNPDKKDQVKHLSDYLAYLKE